MKEYRLTEVWSKDEEYAKHRIPGMIVTDKGTLLIYNEARKEPGDWARMNVFVQRSEDHGETFGERIYLAYGTDEHPTVNNPVMVQDKNGRIHFLHCTDYGIQGSKIFRRYSDDDGLTWSDPIDITPMTRPEFREAFAFGPGHGIRTLDDTLVIPIWLVPKFYASPAKAHGPSMVGTIYSKDNGDTWQIGELMGSTLEVVTPNETEIALLSDGRIYMNSRCSSCNRAVTVSLDGYSGWAKQRIDYTLIDPKCFGSVISYDDGVHPHTMIFANCESKTNRKNVTVKASTDDAVTWTMRKVIDSENGGYVEIAADPKAGKIYVLYELLFGDTCNLATFNYEWLADSNC